MLKYSSSLCPTAFTLSFFSNNRNNNDNNLNDNNDNTNVGNIGSMQMNMNMVMVGRQIQQFAREKQRIKAKLKAIKMMTKGQRPPKTQQGEQTIIKESGKDGHWTSEVKDELTQLLKDIPTQPSEEGKEEGEENNLSLGSLEDFRNVLFSVLLPSAPSHQRQKRSTKQCPANDISLDCIYIGLTFIDFWMTVVASGTTTFQCLQHELCQLAGEISAISSRHAVLRAVENRLAQAAIFYLEQQFHGYGEREKGDTFPKLIYNEGDCGQCP